MAVIKSNDTPTSVRPFSMTDIEAHARTMLLRARQQADQLLAAAQAESEAMKTRGHAEGLAIGKREGVAQGLIEGTENGRRQALEEHGQKLNEALHQMQAITTEFDRSRTEMIQRAESEVLPLAMAVAQKVTKRLGMIDPTVVQNNLRDALRLITNKHEVLVTVHPSHRKIAEETVQEMQARWPQLQHARFVDDEAMSPGGCRVSTAGGEIAAELETQLNRIAAELIPETDISS